MAWLRGVYEAYPRALAELLLIFAVLVLHRWAVTFWYWGVYRLDLVLPQPLSDFFYWVWLEKDIIRAVLIVFLLCFVLTSNILIRRYTFADVGIRLDNFWKSARECLGVVLVILIVAATIVLSFPSWFSFERYFDYNNFGRDIAFGLLSGTFQQFMLQGVFLIRALQLFKSKAMAVSTSSVMFSLLHTPNAMLMSVTVIFAAVCSILFIRNRNIITLGIVHSVVQQLLRVLLTSLMVPGIAYYHVDYYDYTLRVGPRRGDPAYLAVFQPPAAPLSIDAAQTVSVPVRVLNRSNVRWDSDDPNFPAFIGYHVFDDQGNVVSFDNGLTSFEKPVEPGEAASVDLPIVAPTEAGEYFVEVDIVKRELSGARITIWFKWKGSKTMQIPLSVR